MLVSRATRQECPKFARNVSCKKLRMRLRQTVIFILNVFAQIVLIIFMQFQLFIPYYFIYFRYNLKAFGKFDKQYNLNIINLHFVYNIFILKLNRYIPLKMQ